jgi:hypothetical protein
VTGKFGDATPAVATHTAFLAVGIVVLHFEVISFKGIQQHKSIGSDTKAAITEGIDLGRCQTRIGLSTVISHDKIIARSLVFIKMKDHQKWSAN